VLPQGADLGEAGPGEGVDVGRELGRACGVVMRVDVAALAFGDVARQCRVGGGRIPPGMPALWMPAGKPPPFLALP
jgi:hypothetical protein